MLLRFTRRTAVVAGIVAVGLAMTIGALVATRTSGASDRLEFYAQIAPQVDEAQQAMLADGTVTNDEYLAAAENAAQCMRDAGLDARVATGVHPGVEVFGRLSLHDEEELRACGAMHLDRVAVAWADQNQPSPSERAAALRDLNRCYGAALGRNSTLNSEDVRKILETGSEEEAVPLGHCIEANMTVYGFAF